MDKYVEQVKHFYIHTDTEKLEATSIVI